MKLALSILLALFLLLGTFMHLVNPAFYADMIPTFINEYFANIIAGLLEGIIAVGLILPRYRKWGGLAFMFLMIAFLPLHIWDLFREVPAMGTLFFAIIRLLFQFLLIYAGWWIWNR